MNNTDEVKNSCIHAAAVIFLCFLLTSAGYLLWTYHLAEQIPGGKAEMVTLAGGYLSQAVGIALFCIFIKDHPDAFRRIMDISLLIHLIMLVPAVLSEYPAGTVVFGLFMNMACGFIAGGYLCDLTKNVPPGRRASVFGIGYGTAILAAWLLSLIGGGRLYYSEAVLLICAFLTVISFIVIHTDPSENAEADCVVKRDESVGAVHPGKRGEEMLMLTAALVFLCGLVNRSGFTFPSGDIGSFVNVEFSRLLYAAGLLLAGFVTDRNRKYGAVLALIGLVIPFIILALRGESVPVVFLWILSYFAFGFYSVYRVILFSDIASERGALHLAAVGLMTGRIGEAAGEGIGLVMQEHIVVLIILTALVFAVTIVLFFYVYQYRYVPAAGQQSERELFEQYALQHDLSIREREVLRLLLEEKTNAEIADSLCISENTVKFHVRNMLRKTGCRNRKALYASFFGD